MRPLDLNLATRPFRNNTLIWVGHALAVTALVAFSAWAVRNYVDYGARLQDLQGQVDSYDQQVADLSLREERAGKAIGRYDLKNLEVQAETANAVIEGKAFSWTRLFNLLEDVLPYDVKMVSIRPAFQIATSGRRMAKEKVPGVPVTVDGISRRLEDLLEWEEALIRDPHFADVEPVRSAWNRDRQLLFTLKFRYFPDGAPASEQRPAGSPPMPSPTEEGTATAAEPAKSTAGKDAGTAGGESGGRPSSSEAGAAAAGSATREEAE